MNNIEWINNIVGKPWVDRAYGPDAYDCWGVVVDYFKRVVGSPLAEIEGYQSGGDIGALAAEEISGGDWEQLDSSEDRCVFTVVNAQDIVVHVGVILNISKAGLYAIHSKGEGSQVRADRIKAMQRKHSDNLKFYRRVI